MKYITTSISLSMFQSTDYDLEIHQLKEDEFRALIIDAYSCVGYQDVADILGVAYNKEPVKARPGDLIYCANLQQGNLKFYCIRVVESKSDLIRQYEIEEEMIEWL